MGPMLILFALADCGARGVVQDARGRPVAGATVVAERSDGFALGGVTADAQGVYCFVQVPVGAARLTASARLRPPSASPACPDAECCDPRAMEYQPVSAPVAAGRLTLALVPAYCVRGELTNPRARMSIARGGWSATVFVEEGRFLLTSLLPGDYVLTAGHPDTGQRFQQRVTVTAGRRPARLRISVPW